jgi:hypothetical protein
MYQCVLVLRGIPEMRLLFVILYHHPSKLIHAIHHLADLTVNAGKLTVKLFAHVLLAISVHLQHVIQNVSLAQNAHLIEHVLIKNVSIHAQELVESRQFAKLLIIIQYAVAHRDIQAIHFYVASQYKINRL